jgi:hypothetical protein
METAKAVIPAALVASKSREWYTPRELFLPAKSVFGGFDLDPASCFEANQEIGATSYFTADADGLARPWDVDGKPSRVWLNPPSKLGEESAAEWWVYLAKEFMAGRVRCAAFVVFNMSTVQVALAASRVAGVPPPQWGSRVEPINRVKYMRLARSHALPGMSAMFERGKSPPHPSAVVLLSDEPALHETWRKAYADLGEVLPPARMPVRTANSTDHVHELGSCLYCDRQPICTCPPSSEYDPPCPLHGVVSMGFREHPDVP